MEGCGSPSTRCSVGRDSNNISNNNNNDNNNSNNNSNNSNNRNNNNDRDTVLFNVGGKAFEVLREPTLSLHPQSLLTQLAEMQEEGSQEPIFLEANAELFPYILDYHRDRKIRLPANISKAGIIKEAGKLGIELQQDEIAQDTPSVPELLSLAFASVEAKRKQLEDSTTLHKLSVLADIIASCAWGKVKLGSLKLSFNVCISSDDVIASQGGPQFIPTLNFLLESNDHLAQLEGGTPRSLGR
ncbi:unnamed protein product [Polarella glacialis]|uniref:Potassium channel tetramerisation-type BTB domain-containing protein n=1 Tax=Polarella glacialis TaxID=89957 RepID=A0A813KWR7_POLGL|nr:unnamed protein product [Polarella glacialis]